MTQPLPLVRVFAERMRAGRQQNGWSARELAERLQAVGLDWNREIVANLERGKRAVVSLDEWLAVSLVLGIPPLLMCVPLGEVPECQITPTVTADPWQAVQWMNGTAPPPPNSSAVDASEPGYRATWSRARSPLALHWRLNEAVTSLLANAKNREAAVVHEVTAQHRARAAQAEFQRVSELKHDEASANQDIDTALAAASQFVRESDAIQANATAEAAAAARSLRVAFADAEKIINEMGDSGMVVPVLPRGVVEGLRGLVRYPESLRIDEDQEEADG